MENIVINSKDLLNKNLTVLPEKANDFSSNYFWYYTSIGTANLILKNKSIYISNLSTMNDVDEANLHENDKDSVYCFCLCNSNTEKIPLWYLYSGITGRGVSIGFSPKVMLDFINSIKTVTTTDGKTILHRDVDFDLDCGWIFYQKKESRSQVMFKRKWYSVSDIEAFEKNNFFIKSYPWEYEKEFRIVIRRKTNVLKEKYDKLVLNIEPIYNKIKLKLAPELTDDVFAGMLPSLPGFLNFLSRVTDRSKLSINMNLCARNIDGFIDYIKFASESNSVIDYCKICAAISRNCKYGGEK